MKKSELLGVTAAIALMISPAVAFSADKPAGSVATTGTGGVASVQQAQDTSDDDIVTGAAIGAGAAGVGIGLAVALGDDDGDNGSTTSTSTSTATSTTPTAE